MENISERIKREREARGVTIEELAKGTLISVAVLKDIESGKFDKYKGDELYIKMYLRKIAKFLGLEEKELDQAFDALTQEIQLEGIRQDDLNKRLAEENKKNVTISGKMSDTLKDLKSVKRKKPISNKRVYEDRYLLRYFKYALIGILCIAIVFVVWYAIVASRSSDDVPKFNDNDTPTVEGNTDAGKQDSDDNNTNTNDNTPEPTPEVTPIEIIKNGDLDYSLKIDPTVETFTFKVEFVGRSWTSMKYNGSDYDQFKNGIYNNANRSNSLDAQPEVVELTFNTAEFQNMEMTLGYFMGHRFYINDTQIEIDASEYDGSTKTFKLAKVQ